MMCSPEECPCSARVARNTRTREGFSKFAAWASANAEPNRVRGSESGTVPETGTVLNSGTVPVLIFPDASSPLLFKASFVAWSLMDTRFPGRGGFWKSEGLFDRDSMVRRNLLILGHSYRG